MDKNSHSCSLVIWWLLILVIFLENEWFVGVWWVFFFFFFFFLVWVMCTCCPGCNICINTHTCDTFTVATMISRHLALSACVFISKMPGYKNRSLFKKKNPQQLTKFLFLPKSLFQIQTFGVEAPCKTVEDLTSGVVMAQVLQKMWDLHSHLSRFTPLTYWIVSTVFIFSSSETSCTSATAG